MNDLKLSALVINTKWIAEDKVLELEDEFLNKFWGSLERWNGDTTVNDYSVSITESDISIYATWRSKFADYIEEGKYIKDWLLNNEYISDRSDNSRFSLKKIADTIDNWLDDSKNPYKKVWDIDKLLYIVPNNDPHLLAVQEKLKSLRTKKQFNI